MADGFVQVAPDSTGKKIDNSELTVGANTVERQRVVIGDSTAPAQFAAVSAGGALKVDGSAVTQPTSSAAASQADGHSATIGTTTDTSAASTLVGLLKKLISLLPAALAGGGGLKVDLASTAANATALKVDGSAVTQPVSGTVATTNAAASQADGHSASIGTTTDLNTANTVIGRLKQLVTLLAGGLPAALAASGGLKVDVAGTGANATAIKVDGSAVTQPVSAAGLTNLDVALSTRLKPADTLAAVTSITNPVATTAPALTKGTQSANGWSTQNLKDSGRVNIMWTAEFSPAAVAEALLTVTESRDGAATTTFTTKVVTSGKRLRITSWTMTVENTLGVNPKRAKLRMRFNTAGAVVVASPLQANLIASVATAVNTVGQPAFDDFPDGIEFLGDGTKQIGFTLEFPDWVTGAQTGKVYVTIFGFEY